MPSGRLRAAFNQHAVATGWPWAATVRQRALDPGKPPQKDAAPIRVDLGNNDADALADLLVEAAERADSKRGGEWISTARAARILDVGQSTIRGWIARNGPKGNPFPCPDRTDSGRNFWRKATIRKWAARQRSIEDQRHHRR